MLRAPFCGDPMYHMRGSPISPRTVLSTLQSSRVSQTKTGVLANWSHSERLADSQTTLHSCAWLHRIEVGRWCGDICWCTTSVPHGPCVLYEPCHMGMCNTLVLVWYLPQMVTCELSRVPPPLTTTPQEPPQAELSPPLWVHAGSEYWACTAIYIFMTFNRLRWARAAIYIFMTFNRLRCPWAAYRIWRANLFLTLSCTRCIEWSSVAKSMALEKALVPCLMLSLVNPKERRFLCNQSLCWLKGTEV